MITWIDIYGRAREIVKDILDRLTGEDKGKNIPVPSSDEKMASCWENTDRFYEALESYRSYDYRKAFKRLRKEEMHRGRFLRVSAAIGGVAAILACVIVFFWPEKVEEQSFTMAQLESTRKVQAVLINSAGDRFQLNENGYEGIEHGGTLLSADSAGLHYTSTANNTGDTVIYNTVIVPRGGVYQLTLADGTVVWLNSDSRLRYPVAFVGDKRKIYLSGEAYLSVEKNDHQPFIVSTALGEVEVLGTEFNVKYYPEEECIATTLVRGSVSFSSDKVKEVQLIPGQQVFYDHKTDEVAVREVNVNYYIGWREDRLSFHDEKLSDIMRIFSRWYDVQVVFCEEDLKDLSFSGNLDKYERIDTFLHLFELGAPITFEVQGNVVFVRRK